MNFDSDDFLERFRKQMVELNRQTVDSILNYTIQFFSNNLEGNITPVASGVLVSLADRYFVVTAAHVIAEHYNNIFVILPTKELGLGGTLHFTPLPVSGNRNDDKIDIGVLELDQMSFDEIRVSFKFITIDNIGIGHEIEESLSYLSVGFPASKTKLLWSKMEIKALPSPFISEPELRFNYEEFGFSSHSHIAVKFNGKLVSEDQKNINKAPVMEGISGSGLWFLKDRATPAMIKNKQLVGIIIEKIDKNHNKAMVATHIDLVIKLIQQWFQLNI